ncbi:MAG: tape measure protein, partial [Negativicoccus succinicivorans]|nr:tape measure protein [Negativicoccus succinicivorans]
MRHIATANIKVRILGDASALRAEIDSMQDKLNRAFGGEAMAVSRTFAGVLAGTAVAMSGIGVAAIKAAAGLEQTKMAFTSMLGSAQKANEFLEELKDFAAHTPFEFAQVKGAAQKFLAFGFTAKQIIPTLTAVGDAASAMGMGEDGINRLTLALGQMAAKGKVSGEEMRQLAEAGIPAWQMLADSIEVSIPEAMKLAESGAINAQQGLEAIVNGMNDKFSGMMDVQSQTFSGLISTIKDNTTQLLEAI